MGICFVGEKRRFDSFICEHSSTFVHSVRSRRYCWNEAQYIQPKPGPIIELETGRTLGTHDGLWTFTIGQNARIPGCSRKMFVSKKNVEKNEIYVVPGS